MPKQLLYLALLIVVIAFVGLKTRTPAAAPTPVSIIPTVARDLPVQTSAPVWIEMVTSTNTMAGSFGWLLYRDGTLHRHTRNSYLHEPPMPDQKLTAPQLATVQKTIDEVGFVHLPHSMGNGGRGEPSQDSLKVTVDGSTVEVYVFNHGDGDPHAVAFYRLWDLISSFTGQRTSSSPVRSSSVPAQRKLGVP